jgi:hypothetical protein
MSIRRPIRKHTHHLETTALVILVMLVMAIIATF